MIFYPEVKQLGITSKEKAILGLIRALSRLVLFSQKQLSKSSISLETFSTYVNLVFRQCKQVSWHFQESWATFGREKHHFLPILPIVGMRRIYENAPCLIKLLRNKIDQMSHLLDMYDDCDMIQ